MGSIDGMVAAYSTTTGKKHRIPPHWLDDPAQAGRWRKTPKEKGGSKQPPAGTRSLADTPPTGNTPDMAGAADTMSDSAAKPTKGDNPPA